MKLIESALIILVLVGFTFKLLHWEGGDLIIMFALLTLSFLYLIGGYFLLSGLGLRKALKPDAPKPILVLAIFSAIGGLLLSVLVMGIMFWYLYWEGGMEMMFPASVGLAALILISLFMKKKPQAQPISNPSDTLDSGLFATSGKITSFRHFHIRAVAWMILGGLIINLTYSNRDKVVRGEFPVHDYPNYFQEQVDDGDAEVENGL